MARVRRARLLRVRLRARVRRGGRRVRAALAESGLYYIAQIHTCGYPIASGEVGDHVASLEALARLAGGTPARRSRRSGGSTGGATRRARVLRARGRVEAAVGLPCTRRTACARSRRRGHASVLLQWRGRGCARGPPAVTAGLSPGSSWGGARWGRSRRTRRGGQRCSPFANASALTHARVGSPREIGSATRPRQCAAARACEAWWDVVWAAQARAGKLCGSRPSSGRNVCEPPAHQRACRRPRRRCRVYRRRQMRRRRPARRRQPARAGAPRPATAANRRPGTRVRKCP